jgi:hypothetical protein
MQPAFEAEVLFVASAAWDHPFVRWDADRRALTCEGRSTPGSADHSQASALEAGRRPTRDEWEIFWRILDEIGAWEWQAAQSSEPVICDDSGGWLLHVEHAGRSLNADFAPANRRPRFFALFERALDALAGIPRDRSCLLLREREPPAVERLADLLSLAGIVGAAFRKTPSAFALVCHSIEANLLTADLLLELLEELGPLKADVLPVLIAHLGGNDEQAYWNLRALATFGSQARDAFPLLLERLESCAELRIFEAIRDAILAIAPDDARLRARMPWLLGHQRQMVKLAGLAFQRVSPAFEPEVLDALAAMFDSPDPLVLDCATGALDAMSAHPPELLGHLHRSVGDGGVGDGGVQDGGVRNSTLLRRCLANPRIKIRCLHLLAHLGDWARGDLPEIVGFLQDPESSNRSAAVFAVARIAPPEKAMAFVCPLLADPDRGVRQSVLTQLGKLGPRAQNAVSRLAAVIERGETPDADAMTLAIRKIVADKVS